MLKVFGWTEWRTNGSGCDLHSRNPVSALATSRSSIEKVLRAPLSLAIGLTT